MRQNDPQKIHQKISSNIEKGFRALAVAIAEATAEKPSHPAHALHSHAAQKQKQAEELSEELLSFKNRFENGARCFTDGIASINKDGASINMKQVETDITHLTLFFAGAFENWEKIQEAYNSGKSLYEIAGMQPSTIETFYKVAKALYDHKQYQDAADCFAILTFLEPRPIAFWIGFGNAEYFQGHFEAALTAYALAVHANPDDPSPHLYSSRCYDQLGQIDLAINSLDLALFVVGAEPEHVALVKQIKQEKERLARSVKGRE